jgi:hypothetical protein
LATGPPRCAVHFHMSVDHGTNRAHVIPKHVRVHSETEVSDENFSRN